MGSRGAAGRRDILQVAVDMWCPEDYYEDEGTCYECDVGDTIGAICSVDWADHAVPSGTTLEAMVLKKQYWRAHERSYVVYPCAIKAACKGGDGDGQCPPTATRRARRRLRESRGALRTAQGYIGPTCGTCERGWFM